MICAIPSASIVNVISEPFGVSGRPVAVSICHNMGDRASDVSSRAKPKPTQVSAAAWEIDVHTISAQSNSARSLP